MSEEHKSLIRMEPQPRNGAPFQIQAQTVDGRPADWFWFNERLGWPNRTNKMVFQWKCPYGSRGIPVNVEGVWYWKKVLTP